MKLLLDSIRSRTVLTLLVGLTASHLASTAISSLGGWSMHGGVLSAGSIASTLVMAAAIVVFSLWASSWITAPLSDFAHAAERLGMDVNAAPLAEDGPEEVRVAARAFNQMQTRIRSFVDDRLRMLAAISHDLRGPITRVRLRAEQMAIDAETQRKILADLDEMAQMVDSSLAFARDEAMDEATQLVDLSTLLTTVSDDAVDAGHRAEFAFDGRLVFLGRPLALKRLFANLVDNAIRYGRCAEVRASVDERALCVIIEDQGPGIPQSEMENVFKPFFRLERSRNKRTGGIGLGLATARTIARAHGGDVVIENRPDAGLRATVTLPRRAQEEA
ncbi:MAG: ATP-binding protein [Ancalomicrobiaceae bacterium]|nr:ATP-binding protein [Ancalomicrobiaceae bacterium]